MLDVDGVLTNGQLLITEAGELLRSMHVRDGYGMKVALTKGYRIIIITGGRSKGVVDRLKALGIDQVYSGIHDKLTKYKEVIDLFDLDESEILYIGDDLADYPVLRRVGMPITPADGCQENKSVSFYITKKNGGQGCVREVIEMVLKLNGDWPIMGNAKVESLELE